MFDKMKRKANNLKAKWDGLPEDSRKTCVVLGVGSVAALYFYNCGYNWGRKCAKYHYQEELEDIVNGINEKYASVLNRVSTLEELEEAAKSGALKYKFIDFLGEDVRVGLRYRN